ncbi:MAG: transcription-repair coupling factor [Thermodesulfobacteriaceae bacterium]|nr:transcription-repair coupling factor [Thermodesulfobacteriaceae bacterium]
MLKYQSFRDFLESQEKIFTISGVNPAFLAYFLASYLSVKDLAFMVFFPDQEKAKDFLSALKIFTPEKVVLYPTLELPPFSEALSLDRESKERLKILWELSEIKVLAGDIVGFLRKVPAQKYIRENFLYLLPKEKINREELGKDLIAIGYEKVGIVKGIGEFTVKGSVIDLWSPNYSYPVRIDFFGEEVQSLKLFNPETQKTFSFLEELIILPVREVFFPKEMKILYERLFKIKNHLPEKRFLEILHQIENKSITENEEFLLPLFFEKLNFIGENLNRESILIFFEPELIKKRVETFEERVYFNANKAKNQKKLVFEESQIYLLGEEREELFKKAKKVLVRELPLTLEKSFLEKSFLSFSLSSKILESSPTQRLEKAFQVLKESLEEGERVILCVSSSNTQKAILEGLKIRGVKDFRNLEIREGTLKQGFYFPEISLWLTSEYELFGKKTHLEDLKKTKKVKTYFRNFEDLKSGDYVVHRVHGIGRYWGLKFLKVDGVESEFIEIEYEGGDRLYLPVSRLDELYPYVGLSDKEPKLDRLGKKHFLKRKKEVEKALTEVVQELLSLYAERKAMKSYALSFSPLVYEEFSATFPYEETPDQQIAIEEVISDLREEKVMERLLVGDVGFGKTEVALRAAFLVAYSGKQVAFLVPTTILAEQHYRNFKERLEPFGINIGVLSRLRPEKEQKKILEKLAKGEIQVVIGTHKLLLPEVQFKDLGLLIIDEEHRFGVKQKERLKQLKKKVKVLLLSATPIPRSLQLSLLGIFDLSIIETPPPGRKSIKTIIAKFEPEIIKHAIEYELQRKGQVFFVNPYISGLQALLRYLKNLVPSAQVEIIHGQMPSERIEKNLIKFINKEIDVLVCTPIIGSGIDIPSANTILINQADRFGLADIYQLRGRVGRSDVEAYAYLLVPSLKALSEQAQKRLKALMQFAEIGSGFKLALSDLKIRGAGELLGINQSGHINSIGYELYLELLENTIKNLKGEEVHDWEPHLDLKIPAYLPSDFIPETEERLSIYKELVLLKTTEELEDFKSLLEDKYGVLPEPVENLIKIYYLKILMKKLSLPLIELKGKNLLILVKEENLSSFKRVLKFLPKSSFYLKKENSLNKLIFKIQENPLDFTLSLCQKLLS